MGGGGGGGQSDILYKLDGSDAGIFLQQIEKCLSPYWRPKL